LEAQTNLTVRLILGLGLIVLRLAPRAILGPPEEPLTNERLFSRLVRARIEHPLYLGLAQLLELGEQILSADGFRIHVRITNACPQALTRRK
jgi:hypothetical protein